MDQLLKVLKLNTKIAHKTYRLIFWLQRNSKIQNKGKSILHYLQKCLVEPYKIQHICPKTFLSYNCSLSPDKLWRNCSVGKELTLLNAADLGLIPAVSPEHCQMWPKGKGRGERKGGGGGREVWCEITNNARFHKTYIKGDNPKLVLQSSSRERIHEGTHNRLMMAAFKKALAGLG